MWKNIQSKNDKMITLRRLAGLLAVLQIILSVALPVRAVNEGELHWYCVRNKEHRQPVLESNMRFIEQYEGYYVDHKHDDKERDKVVYLTFDAGYENGNVEKILNVLKEESVQGAFFILGNLIQRNKSLVLRMKEEGHLICNHTMHHHNMTKVTSVREFEHELKALEDLYYDTFGSEMAKYYRPPEGTFNETTMKYAKDLGYQTIFWSLAYADWDNDKQPTPEYAKEKIMSNLHNGAVILLHPTSATNAAIMKDLIQSIRKEGYRFGNLHELTGKSR